MHKNIAIATAFGLLLGYSTTAGAGLVFTQVATTDGETSAVTRVTTDGENGKAETLESALENSFMPPGSYMLFTAGDMYLVNPAMRTFARFDTGMFAGLAGGMAGQFEIKDTSVEKVVDEPGERIAGYATRHYQFKSSWTMAMKGMPMSTQTTVVEDVWTTTEIDVPAMPIGAEGGAPAEVAALAIVEGFPLRRVTKQGTKTNMGAMPGLGGLGGRPASRMAGGGGGDETTTTMEIRDIEQVEVAAATFEVPAGYSETQLFQTGPALPSLNGVQESPGAPAVPSLNNLDN
jgi:hypothetical protein